MEKYGTVVGKRGRPPILTSEQKAFLAADVHRRALYLDAYSEETLAKAIYREYYKNRNFSYDNPLHRGRLEGIKSRTMYDIVKAIAPVLPV